MLPSVRNLRELRVCKGTHRNFAKDVKYVKKVKQITLMTLTDLLPNRQSFLYKVHEILLTWFIEESELKEICDYGSSINKHKSCHKTVSCHSSNLNVAP